MTVTYDITTNVGKVRLLIGDNVLADYKFTDEEIEFFLSQASNNLNLAAAEALEAWASSYGAQPDSETIGDYAYTQKIVDKMLRLAQRLKDQDAGKPYQTYGSFDLTGIEDTTIED